jgi:hypothetical protein
MFDRSKYTFSISAMSLVTGFILSLLLYSCPSHKEDIKDEQIRISNPESSNTSDSLVNSIQGNISLKDIATKPFSVILTGMPNHRLVPVYKIQDEEKRESRGSSSSGYSSDYSGYASDAVEHFMPGIDILFGYKLLNLAHYDLKTEGLNLFFNHPVLVKTLYYPAFIQDSIDKKPVSRDYYLISVYDEDTNKDSLINRKDLRRFYHFGADGTTKTLLVPANYSVIHSQYDSQNDLMYIFARQDVNKNGMAEEKEPIHIFWIDLKAPKPAKLLY